MPLKLKNKHTSQYVVIIKCQKLKLNLLKLGVGWVSRYRGKNNWEVWLTTMFIVWIKRIHCRNVTCRFVKINKLQIWIVFCYLPPLPCHTNYQYFSKQHFDFKNISWKSVIWKCRTNIVHQRHVHSVFFIFLIKISCTSSTRLTLVVVKKCIPSLFLPSRRTVIYEPLIQPGNF